MSLSISCKFSRVSDPSVTAIPGFANLEGSPLGMIASNQDDRSDVIVAVMGASGTGKSSFINLLTGDRRIQIGHDPESHTIDVREARYVDQSTGRSVVLVDTPGFDDSREYVTDTDILEKLVHFLEPAAGKRRTLNGIIYMHRISDPRVGGVSRKNLRMFHSLCGDDNLKNVRIVTTNWSRVGKEEGDQREEALRTGAFKELLNAHAGMCRHSDTAASARSILSELIPLKAVTMQIQQELAAGLALRDTSAGKVLTADMREMKKKHEKELAELKKEMEEAAKNNDLALRAELAKESIALEHKMMLAEEDKGRLSRTLYEARAEPAIEQDTTPREQTIEQYATLKQLLGELQADGRRLSDNLKGVKETFQKLNEELQEAMRANESFVEQLATERREIRDQADKQFTAVRNIQVQTAEETKRLAAEVQASKNQRQRLEGERREAMQRFDFLMEQFEMDRRKLLELMRKRYDANRNLQPRMGEETRRLVQQEGRRRTVGAGR